jgi:DNA-binding MarR family transcriptional regulator
MPVPSDHLNLDEQLCFALYAASRAMTAAYAPALEPLGVTYPQYLVLLVLWEQDGLRVSHIGERLHLDSATLTPLLKRLEAQGVVERRRSSRDERVVEVHLTAEGRALRRRATEVPKRMLSCAGMSPDAAVTLRRTLRQLTRKLRGT